MKRIQFTTNFYVKSSWVTADRAVNKYLREMYPIQNEYQVKKSASDILKVLGWTVEKYRMGL